MKHAIFADSRISVDDDIAAMVKAESLIENIFGNLKAKACSQVVLPLTGP